MLTKLLSLFETELSPLQQKEVDLGYENGLSEEEVNIYNKSYYNYLQMKEIRLSLQHEIDRYQLQALCHPYIDAEKMYRMRVKLENGELVRKKRMHQDLWYLFSSIVLMTLCFSFLWTKMNTLPSLQLKTNEVTLHVGEEFIPEDYIEDVKKENGILTLPERFTLLQEEDQIVVYQLQSNQKTITKVLKIHSIPQEEVVSDTP